MQEMQVRSLSQEDPLEKDMATHASILPGKPTPILSLYPFPPSTNNHSLVLYICKSASFLLYLLVYRIH